MSKAFFHAVLLALSLAWAAPVPFYPALAQQAPAAAPEGPSGVAAPRRAAVATKYMAAAANPLAAEAGRDILRQGGSAVDAAIAMAMVLNLVEPQSAGIGGGGFLLHYDASAKKIVSFDGRETAPAGARADMFMGANGEPVPFRAASVGGQAIATPGLLRMLETAHREFGRLPWSRMFEPAMNLAEAGFIVSPRLHELVSSDPELARMPAARAYFFDAEGKPRTVGARLENPVFFETLRLIANGGADAFYRGPIARDILAAASGPEAQLLGSDRLDDQHRGRLSTADLTLYRAVRRDPVCGPYRGLTVCSMGPPSSGGVAIAQTLGILDRFTLRDLSPGSLEAVHLIAEATRLAFADRARYLADPDFIPVPVRGLLSSGYIAGRAQHISPTRSMGVAPAGQPAGRAALLELAPNDAVEAPATTHVSVVDAAGNAVALTASIEQAFGSHVFVRGFLLNNHMTDFSLRPTVNGAPAINRIEPGKRPLSAMSPTIVMDRQKRLVMTLGSPGGPRIIPYVVQTLVAAIDWRLDMQRAVSLPHFVNLNGAATELERDTPLAALAPALETLGHKVVLNAQTSGLQGIMVVRNGVKTQLVGGADPRREGQALGD